MGNRRELKNIAFGIAGSFNSRNNSVEGYWGIGKLYKFVELSTQKRVVLDLLSGIVTPITSEFDSLRNSYRDMLLTNLSKREIPRVWVVHAEVSAEFEIGESRFSDYGNPCIVLCEIIDDTGRHHLGKAHNVCRPHDPKKERKNSR